MHDHLLLLLFVLLKFVDKQQMDGSSTNLEGVKDIHPEVVAAAAAASDGGGGGVG